MKTICTLLVASIVVLVAASCGNGQTEPPNSDADEPAAATPEVVCPEPDEGWSVYHDPESGLSFCYLAEWGEVIDYVDYFKALVLADMEDEELSAEEAAIEDWESMVRESGRFLSFSNLDMDWGAHVRITSLEQMESFIDEVSASYAAAALLPVSDGPWMGPLFGFFSYLFLLDTDFREEYLNPDFELPDYEAELPQIIRDIADLPENASAEELQDATLPLSPLFANALRSLDLAKTTYGQIATDDGALSGVTEAGTEGFDVGVRDYWDCILTDAEGNRFVYISFTLPTPPGDQPAQFRQFVGSLTLTD